MNRRPLARQPRPHLPQRPLWLCRVCAGPWPCGEARLVLLREHAADLIYLRIYLASQMHEALRDLIRLNPSAPPTAESTFERFLAWAAPPAVTPARPDTCPAAAPSDHPLDRRSGQDLAQRRISPNTRSGDSTCGK